MLHAREGHAWPQGPTLNTLHIGADTHSNNTAELSAAYWAMKEADLNWTPNPASDDHPSLTLTTDSQYVKGILDHTINPQTHALMIGKLRRLKTKLLRKCTVQTLWVKGHSRHKGNDQADAIAKRSIIGQGTLSTTGPHV